LRPFEILRSARARKELTSLETLILLESDASANDEILAVADLLNESINGREVGYVRARKIHYTNVCRAKCKICSFFTTKGSGKGFSETPESIVAQVRRGAEVSQITLSGGLNPDLNIKYHVRLMRALRDKFPNLTIHGYSPTEILFLSRRSRLHYREVLRQLKDAGLDSMSGDSAIILNDKIRKKIASDKLKTNDWIEIIRTAHNMEIATTATMLFGHIENEVFISEHLDIVKRMQKETGYFTALELVPFIPESTALHRERRLKKPLTPDRMLKVCAIARLSVGDLFKNIQLDWNKVGLPVASRALNAGINDLGGIYFDEHEIRTRRSNGRGSVTPAMVESAISRAKKIPVERKPHTIRRPRYSFSTSQAPYDPVYIRNF
jgi:CofH subfamily radical SAM domain protein